MFKKEDVVAREAKFAVYRDHVPVNGLGTDILIVKEQVHLKSGEKVPAVRIIENYKKTYYTTKPGKRVHKDRKLYEKLENLDRHECTQVNLCKDIANSMGRPGVKKSLRMWANSPYLYGCDIPTTNLIRRDYARRWPDVKTAYTVAGLDSETDVLNGTNEIISLALTFKNKHVIAYTESFMKGVPNAKQRIRDAYSNLINKVYTDIEDKKIKGLFEKYLRVGAGEFNAKDIELDIYEGKDAGDVLKYVFKKAHEWKPDFIEIWNAKFDVTEILDVCDKYGIDAGDLLSDPAVPKKYRTFYLKWDNPKKTKNDKEQNKNVLDLWHVYECAASFAIIDGMVTYKKLRAHEGNKPSYSLDFTLESELNLTKLYLDDPDLPTEHNLKWHRLMQAQHKIEYMVYMDWDCTSMEILDLKTNDLSLSLPLMCRYSEYAIYPSIPKRRAEDLHFYFLEQHRVVIGTTPKELQKEIDEGVVEKDGWIGILPAFMTDNNGIPMVKGFDNVRSLIRLFNFDLDCVSTYPTAGEVFNIEHETTEKELVGIAGKDLEVRRITGFNLTAVNMNCLEICTAVMNMPTLSTMLDAFSNDIEAGLV